MGQDWKVEDNPNMLFETRHEEEDRSPRLMSLLNHGLLPQYPPLLFARFTHELSLWNEGKNFDRGSADRQNLPPSGLDCRTEP